MEASTSRQQADASLQPPPHRRAIIGNTTNFWLHSTRSGFDLTHPSTPKSPPIHPRLSFTTTTTPITVDPAKTALVIIDMQNFFLSEAFGRNRGPGHVAQENLLKYAIPAARKAGVRVVWVNWGLTQGDVDEMPPAIKRAFGFEAVADGPDEGIAKDGVDGDAQGEDEGFGEREGGIAVDKHGEVRHQGGHVMLENGKNGRIYKGLAADCGKVTLPDGTEVDAGKLLMRDQWNAALHPPLDAVWEEGQKLESKPDVWIHKNRMSGLWGGRTPCIDFLEKEGIRTLLFTGVNTDQCVGGSLQDAFSLGYDCILLGDGCGTTSPQFSQDCMEFNAGKTWGFLSSCKDFADGVDNMGK